MNQQSRRATIDDQEVWWSENLYPIGPGNLRSMWGPSTPIYTAPSGTTILRIFFGYIGTGDAAEGLPPPAQGFLGPPPGRLGFMCLSDGNIDTVDLDSGTVVRIGVTGASGGSYSPIWNPVPPNYWCSIKVWRPQFVGNTIGQQGGVVIGSPEVDNLDSGGNYISVQAGGLYAWDGTTTWKPDDPSPEWLSSEVPGVDTISPMPHGLPGIYTMEIYQERLWIAGKDVITFSAPDNGANFSTFLGGGSFGYFGNKLTYAYMDMAGSAGYMYVFGDSSTDLVNNVQFSGQGTTQSPFTTNFLYANIDPQIGQRFPRPVGVWGRYFTMYNGAGIFEMVGGDSQLISQKMTNIYDTLDTSAFMPTMCPVTMFGNRMMLMLGKFTDPWGVSRSLLLVWNGELWTVASQHYALTHIGYYEDNSVITAYGTDGTNLYRLFDHPDATLPKKLATKAYSGTGTPATLTIKNFKRLFLELHDLSGLGVSLTGTIDTMGGGVPGGSQDIRFELTAGVPHDIIPCAITAAGIVCSVDLNTTAPDFIIERLHIAADERTLWGA